jgi:hypothetical protein
MATDNPSWGYTRIQGALKNLGHRVARSTVAKILKEQGIPPSRERPMTWHTFVRAHWRALLAADFFTTEVWTVRGLVTYYTVFVIDLASRRMHLVGSTLHPNELFMPQVGRATHRRRSRSAGRPSRADLRSRPKVDAVGSAALGDVGDPNCADAVPGAQREGLRFILHLIGPGCVASSGTPPRRTARGSATAPAAHDPPAFWRPSRRRPTGLRRVTRESKQILLIVLDEVALDAGGCDGPKSNERVESRRDGAAQCLDPWAIRSASVGPSTSSSTRASVLESSRACRIR